jgi:hypothetical protein
MPSDTEREKMGTSTIIAIISLGISVIAVIITLSFNLISHQQYMKSLDPLLSFRLIEYHHFLYLSVSNTGKSVAKNIRIEIVELLNNGNDNELHLDAFFQNEFELYPTETVQGMIGIYGENVVDHVFPVLKAHINYKKEKPKSKCQYSRTITFTTAYENKILADVNIDTKKIDDSVTSLSRSNIRIANYLDGHQLFHFDSINIKSDSSLKNDMFEVYNKNKKIQIKNRTQEKQSKNNNEL